MIHDYSHHEVLIQPTARKLYEQMSRREWADAEKTAQQLADLAFEMRQYSLRQMVHSGVGYVYEGA